MALYDLRDKLTRGAEYGQGLGADCRRFKNPRAVATANNLHAPPTTPADAIMRGVRAGGELWFPLPAEAEAVARPIGAEVRAEEEAERARVRGIGGRPAVLNGHVVV